MRILSLLGALALGLPATSALADDCGPLQQVNSIDILGGPNRPLVQVGLNGTPKLFLLDTGGDISQINGTVAQELKLPEREAGLKMLDLYGHASNKRVEIEKFTLGHQTGEDIDMMVQPNPKFGEGTPFVGIFAPDLMGRYDVEFDFANRKMNYFSTDHCPGHVVYWPHQALAITPMTFRNRHIRLPVQLDGKEIQAEIDTGSGNTNLTAEAARQLFDIKPDTPGNLPLNMPGMAAAFGRVFTTLDFEGVAVKNPHIIIRPDLVGSKDPDNRASTESRARRVDQLDDQPDLLIGMDVLKRLRLYAAFKEDRLYISEATRPVAAKALPASSVTGTDAPADAVSAAPSHMSAGPAPGQP